MIELAEHHYAAIGRVVVESCFLDNEVAAFLTNLGTPPPPKLGIRKKLSRFQAALSSQQLSTAALTEFSSAVQRVQLLIDRRNALAHGVWVPDCSSPRELASIAHGDNATVHASEVSEVASKLRIARKLLLRLCQDHLPVAAGQLNRISASSAELAQQL